VLRPCYRLTGTLRFKQELPYRRKTGMVALHAVGARGFAEAVLLLLGIPVAMKWGQTRWISSETRPATVDAAEG
jgi:hypothetical protein